MAGLGLVDAPGGFVPEHVVAFGAAGTPATAVDPAHPLPTAPTMTAAGSTPLAGTATASGLAGPFAPQLGRAIWLTLAGTWTGSVTVQRSTDGGATRLPLTLGGAGWASFTANAQEPVGEEGDVAASWYLAITLTGGSLTYRVAQ